MDKKLFYSISENEICLPCSLRTIIDSFCDEYNELDTETRLMYISYAASHGYNFKKEIEMFLENHTCISADSIKKTLCTFISYMRYGGSSADDMYRCLTDTVLEDTLPLNAVIDLLVVEALMRFSYEENSKGEIIFSQKYLRWKHIIFSEKGKNPDEVKAFIIRPTGYKAVTDHDIRMANHWGEITKGYNQYDLYSETRQHIYPEDADIIQSFNAKAPKECKYVLGIPAEPWQGNPLTAKLIILSLNAGYDEKYNKDAALSLRASIIEGVWREKARTLRLEAESFLPLQKEYADAFNTIGANYWYNKLRGLKSDLNMDDQEFFKKIALVQYCAYTSQKYQDFPKDTILPSQLLTKDIIRDLVYNHPDTKFVIMRSWKKWRNLLDDDVWFMMQPRLIVNTNMSQALTKGNLGDNKYQEILDALSSPNH